MSIFENGVLDCRRIKATGVTLFAYCVTQFTRMNALFKKP